MSNNIFDKKSENDYEDSKNDNNEFNTNLENNTKNILLSENYQTIEIKQDLDEDKDEELDEDKDEDQDKDEELDEDEDKDEDQDINDVSNTFDDKKDKINECEKYLNKTLNNILDKFIKDTLINGNIEPNKNEYNKNDCDINIDNKNNSNEIFYPISFDLVIENYDTNGNKEIKSISSSNGKITQDDKSINDLIDIKNETDENETNESELEKIKLNKTKQYYKNKDRNKDKKEISKTNKFISLRKVDYASSIGDIKFLNKWTDSIILSDSYTSEAIDNASANGKIEVLDWWINANKKFEIELKYTEKAINLASKFDKIESLDWWINSGLELKYNHNAIDYASSECKIRVLDWWLSKSIKEKLLKFEYTSKSIDNAKLEEQKLLKLVKWWKNTISKNKEIKFKYTRDFIEHLESWNYIDVYKYLIENKLISSDEKFSYSNNKDNNDSGLFKMFELFGVPIGISSSPSIGKKQSKNNSKYDIESLPEDIQKHIKEKEEELNNNMMINGKAKEYIDNLIKIPFGKYKYEKIFCFINDLITKINSINSICSNDFIKKYKLLNESDLNKFFDSVKFNTDNIYEKYQKIYNEFIEIRKNYIEYVNDVLNDCVYGHISTKKHLKCIISQWLSGGFKFGIVIGIQGPPGVGKTTIIKGALSKCLVDFVEYDLEGEKPYISQLDKETIINSKKRPFCFTSLGGTTNGSTLSGHNITYHGATSGDIVKHLKDAEIMNPILYFDELDKISNTEHGHEISSVLTHITDPAQNSHFTDRYFAEVKIDLSKAIIIFSYNDTNKIDRILLDRIQEIKLNPIKPKEKLVICRKFIIPEVCSQLGYNTEDIVISDSELNIIVNEYTMEAGVRKLKEKIFEIFRMRHLELVENPKLKISNVITNKFVSDTFSDYHKINYKKIKQTNMIGCINGLYASTTGLGGITPIQIKQIYSKDIMSIGITGSVEKVMEESIKVAKTVGWNLINKEEQDNIIKMWDSRGFHIHFPDGATPKDGPSGGTAITCAFYSLLTNKHIKKDIAITGEIDLNGNVTEIGGLDAKLNGAKKAGIKLALIPKENHREFEIVKKNNPELIDKNFKVIEISNVSQALKYIF
jgi:ATP-dependent Lon protease